MNHYNGRGDGAGPAPEIIRLENERVELKVLPEVGGKMVELTNKESGTQFLYDKKSDDFPKPVYGDVFDERYAYGFDECFPTVAPCTYNRQGKKVDLPDHGELWSQSWAYESRADSMKLWAEGKKFDYTLEKHLRLRENAVVIDYTLTNNEEAAFDYLWSSHPLLAVGQGDELLLDREITEVMINWAADERLGVFGDWTPWPECRFDGLETDFSVVQDESLEFAAKFFTNKLSKGRAGIYRTQSDDSLLFSFDTDQIPHLGIWLCYGGWPSKGTSKSYTIALEPCRGIPDSLESARRRGDQMNILPSETHRWQLELTLVQGRYNLENDN